MPSFDRFLVAPINTGLQKNIKSWMIMDDAFEYLQNAYVYRGRVRKRIGSVWMGPTQANTRLRASLAAGGAGVGITDAGGNATGNVRTILGDATLPLAAGQMFSIGANFDTVVSNVAGAQPMIATQGTGTFNVANGNFTITGSTPLTTIFFYPALPVMGIGQYDVGAINNHPTYAFDMRYAYVFTGGAWARSGAAIWHGSNTNYFWIDNWQSIAGDTTLFVSNFNAQTGAGQPTAADDPIWYTSDGTTWFDLPGTLATTRGFFFLPGGNAPYTGPFVQTARIIVPFKNRLVLINTIENDNSSGTGTGTATAFESRARYCWYGSPLAVNAWYEPNQQDNAGNVSEGGGYVDAATQEQAISAEFIKDRLIVYFERSTWELAYTGNEIQPFVWQKINTELGSQSTFSTIPFDKEVLTIGNTGVHACNGSNVFRIDEKIPDEVFDFNTKTSLNNTTRTVGIRDYYNELAFWTFVSDLEEATQTFPNQILLYNYKNQSWALFDDCFTFFGYFEQKTDVTWASSAPVKWEQFGQAWNSALLQANQRQILAGTPEGFIVILQSEVFRNAPTLSITNITFAATGIITLTIINHNLSATPEEFPNDNDFLLIENVNADITTATFLNNGIFPVNSIIDANNITIDTFGALTSGTYNGAGTAARVSNVQIFTKRFNPYVNKDRNVYVQRIDFAVQKTVNGQITVDYFASSAPVSMLQGAIATGSIMGNSILETVPYGTLYPLEDFQTLLWHPIYFQSSGEFIQLALYFSAAQMVNPNISLSDFQLEGFLLYTQPTSDRLQ